MPSRLEHVIYRRAGRPRRWQGRRSDAVPRNPDDRVVGQGIAVVQNWAEEFRRKQRPVKGRQPFASQKPRTIIFAR